MTPFKIALDWTPNTIHAGIYVALLKGYYKTAGLDVEILHPGQDNYKTYPIKRVEEGAVEIGLCPSEHVIAWNSKEDPAPITAVAATFHQDMSAYIYHKGSGIQSPKDFDGKRYGCYKSNFELGLLKRCIEEDGGKGEFEIVAPGKLSVWEKFKNKELDFCWVFKTWEGADAEREGLDIGYLKQRDYGIPYGYSPVFAANYDALSEKSEDFKAFLSATSAGYKFAAAHPEETAQLLHESKLHDNFKELDFLVTSMGICADAFLNKDLQWGRMDEQRWEDYLVFLEQEKIVEDEAGKAVKVGQENKESLFSNQYLPSR